MIGDHARFIELFEKITQHATVKSLDFEGPAYKHQGKRDRSVWVRASHGTQCINGTTYVKCLEQIVAHLENGT